MKQRQVTHAELERRTSPSEMRIGDEWFYRSNDDPAYERATIIRLTDGRRGEVTVRFDNSAEAVIPVSHLRHHWSEREAFHEAELRWFVFNQFDKPSDAEFDAASRVTDYILDRKVGAIVDGRGRGAIGVSDRARLVDLAGLALDDIAGRSWILEGETFYYAWPVTLKIVIALLTANPQHAEAIATCAYEEVTAANPYGVKETAAASSLLEAARLIHTWASTGSPRARELTVQELAQHIRISRISNVGQTPAPHVSDLVLAKSLLGMLSITATHNETPVDEEPKHFSSIRAGQHWLYAATPGADSILVDVVDVLHCTDPYPVEIQLSGGTRFVSTRTLVQQIGQ